MSNQINQEIANKALGSINDEEVVRFTQDFVRVNSVNPNLESGSSETAAAEFLSLACKEVGIQTSMPEIAPGRSNFYAVLPGQSEQIGLAFFGHIDTIALIGMQNPFSGEIVDGHIWGRGSVDQKGGVAASVQALIALARSGVPLKKSVAVWGVADEESEHRGAYAISKSGWKADFAISTEPAGRAILLGHKGTIPLQIDIEGVPAHGCVPKQGINAIGKASKVIQELDKLELKKASIPELDLELQGTINLGVIQGGSAYNVVADHCSLFLDRRTIPGETNESCLAEIQQIIDRLAADDPDFKAKVEISRPDWHWEPIKQRGLMSVYSPLSSPVAQAVQAAYRYVKDEEVALDFGHGYTDMDFFVNSMGIPTINYGPGEGMRYAHTVDEMLCIDQLLEATRIYVLAALQLAA